MGGSGSGEWARLNTKPLVEDCLVLDVNRLARDRVLVPWRAGVINWCNTHTGENYASVNYTSVLDDDSRLALLLRYAHPNGQIIADMIRLQTTPQHFGGCRWWFKCPLTEERKQCGRRVGRLYLLNRHFACRHCLNLTYRSVQEAHQEERFLSRYRAR